jgi:hypothetical protein
MALVWTAEFTPIRKESKAKCAVTTIPLPEFRASSITSRIKLTRHAHFICYFVVEESDALSYRRAEPTKNGFLDKL